MQISHKDHRYLTSSYSNLIQDRNSFSTVITQYYCISTPKHAKSKKEAVLVFSYNMYNYNIMTAKTSYQLQQPDT